MRARKAALVAIVCGLVCQFSAATQAQVCVVDVAKVFENHTRFNAELDGLRQAAEEYKMFLQRSGEKLRQESEGLNDMNVGSPDYKALETRLAQEAAALEVERTNKNREFIQAEAKLHFDTYVEVTQLISNYCQQRGYRMALRFNKFTKEPDSPQSIMQRVNDYVIFHRPQIDITDQIIAAVAGDARVGGLPPQTNNK